jgi:hypothetical protein
MTLATAAPQALWYATRGAGATALVLLTASVALGVVTTARWRSARWPRFAVAALHRNLTLLTVAFVAVHVLTTVLDGYAPIGLVSAVVPFSSPYRPLWLGLGAIAFDLLLALVATSLLRQRIGLRPWRLVHWLAYACWPVALVHALGTGSDGRAGWLQWLGAGCVAAVVLAVLVRAARAAGPAPVRLAAAATALLVPALVWAWYAGGPGRAGWARRAGTPVALLASARTRPAVARAPRVAATLPRRRFTARLSGTVRESRDASGSVTISVRGRLHGGPGGSVRIDLRGSPLDDGVLLTASGVSYVPQGSATVYTGSVTELAGQRVGATVTAPRAGRLRLDFLLELDPESGSATATVTGRPQVRA